MSLPCTFQIVLAIKLGMDAKKAVSSVTTLSDVEGLCVSFAGNEGSSDPGVAVKVHICLKSFDKLFFYVYSWREVCRSRLFFYNFSTQFCQFILFISWEHTWRLCIITQEGEKKQCLSSKANQPWPSPALDEPRVGLTVGISISGMQLVTWYRGAF